MTPEVERFLERVTRLTSGEMMAIVAHGDRQDPWQRRLATRSADRAAKAAHLTRELDEVRELIIGWATDAGPATGQVPGFAMTETLEGNLRRRAAPHLIDAATATVLGDRIPRPDAAALLEAWRAAAASSTTRA